MSDPMSTTKEKEVTLWEETNSTEPRMKSESSGESGECDIIESISDSKEPVLSTDITGKKKVSGIYKIVNKVNGKYYVGSSCNMCGDYKGTRWKRHMWHLNNNTHHNDYLQRAWNKYGAKNFEFVIVEICSPRDLLKLEQQYLNLAKYEQDKCYNLLFESGGGKWSEHSKQKLSQKRKGSGNPMFGKIFSESHRQKIGDALRGRRMSDITKSKLRQNLIGIPRTSEIKKKISKGNSGKHVGILNKSYSHIRFKFVNTKTSETFEGTQYEFYTKYAFRQSDVSALVHKKQKSCKGWIIL